MPFTKDSSELARLCSLDLGQEITPDEVRIALLTGSMPERLGEDDRADMLATLLKEVAA